MLKHLLLFGIAAACLGCGGPEEHAGHEGHTETHAEDTAARVVHLDPEWQSRIGLQTAAAQEVPLRSVVRVFGETASETEDVAHLTAPHPGLLERWLAPLGATVDMDTEICVLRAQLGETHTVRSPQHGIVLARYVEIGERVDTLTTLATIADPDLLKVNFDVYEKDLGIVRIGQKVRVSSVAYPDKVFEGEIVFISPQVDPTTRTVKIRANVDNREHLLKFGMFVKGEILADTGARGLAVPAQAVQDIEGIPSVFVPDEEHADEFHVRPVKTGERFGDVIEIHKGLDAGESVVTAGSFYLKSEHEKGSFGDGHAH